MRQQAGSRDSGAVLSASSGEISGKLNISSSVMDIRRRTERGLEMLAQLPDFGYTFTPDESQFGRPSPDRGHRPTRPILPGLFDAIQQQRGLKFMA